MVLGCFNRNNSSFSLIQRAVQTNNIPVLFYLLSLPSFMHYSLVLSNFCLQSDFDQSQKDRLSWDQLHYGVQSVISFLAKEEKKHSSLSHPDTHTDLVYRPYRFCRGALCSTHLSSHGGFWQECRDLRLAESP